MVWFEYVGASRTPDSNNYWGPGDAPPPLKIAGAKGSAEASVCVRVLLCARRPFALPWLGRLRSLLLLGTPRFDRASLALGPSSQPDYPAHPPACPVAPPLGVRIRVTTSIPPGAHLPALCGPEVYSPQ